MGSGLCQFLAVHHNLVLSTRFDPHLSIEQVFWLCHILDIESESPLRSNLERVFTMTDFSFDADRATADLLIKTDTALDKALGLADAARAKIFAPWHKANITLAMFDAENKALSNTHTMAFAMVDKLAWLSVSIKNAKGKAVSLSDADIATILGAKKPKGNTLFQGIRLGGLNSDQAKLEKAKNAAFTNTNWNGQVSTRRATIKAQYKAYLKANDLLPKATLVEQTDAEKAIEKTLADLQTALNRTAKVEGFNDLLKGGSKAYQVALLAVAKAIVGEGGKTLTLEA